MKLSDLEREVRAIAAEIEMISNGIPELSGFGLAWERGNITQEEWESVQAEAAAGSKRLEAEVARIDQLREQHPVLMATLVTDLIARIGKLQEETEAKLAGIPDAQQDRTLSFNRLLLPDISSGLVSWRDRTPNEHSMSWAWRLAFRMADETQAALAK